MKASKLFTFATLLGAALTLVSFALLGIDDSPYRFGKAAGLWFLVQITSATLLMYAGTMGGFAAVTKIGRPWVGIASLGFCMALVAGSVILAIMDDTPITPPSLIDTIAVWVAIASMGFAVLTGSLAIYYNYWVVRFQRNIGIEQ